MKESEQPAESETPHAAEAARAHLDAMRALNENVWHLTRLREACLAVLTDAEGRLAVEARAADVLVLVPAPFGPPQKRRLSELLAELRREDILPLAVEVKSQDPRTLLLQTIQTIRGHLETFARLSDRLYDVREIEAWHTITIQEIEAESPDAAQRIRQRLQARRSARLALGPNDGGDG